MGKLPELLRGLVSVLTHPDVDAVRAAAYCLRYLAENGKLSVHMLIGRFVLV